MKKTHIYALVFVLVLVLACLLLTGARHAPQSQVLSGMEFLLDPGHGGFDGGAVSKSGVKEAPLNLSVALLLKSELEARGAAVSMTRQRDTALGESKREDMDRRRELAGAKSYTAVISVHMNNFTQPQPNGPTVFYLEGDGRGAQLGQCVQNALDALAARTARQAKTSGFFLFEATESPCILVECGFLSNPSDLALLQDQAHQQALAAAIAQAVEYYFAPQTGVPAWTAI